MLIPNNLVFVRISLLSIFYQQEFVLFVHKANTRQMEAVIVVMEVVPTTTPIKNAYAMNLLIYIGISKHVSDVSIHNIGISPI